MQPAKLTRNADETRGTTMGKEKNCIRSFPARIMTVRRGGPAGPPAMADEAWRDLRHDLLGALSAIQNTLFLLNREDPRIPERTKVYLEMIASQARRMEVVLEGAFTGGQRRD